MLDSQIIGVVSLVAIAVFGIELEGLIHPYLVISLAAVIGSIQATAARMSRGFIKGFGAITWTLIAGVSSGLLLGLSVGKIMGMTDNIAIILPVYIFSIIGGRLLIWIIVDVDIAQIGNNLIDRLMKK